MSSLLIKNGFIVTAEKSFYADVLIVDEKIVEIGKDIKKNLLNLEIIDAKGYFVLPGGVDPHVHMSLRTGNITSADDFESGTKAAIKGGTTTIIDFVTPLKKRSLLKELYDRKKVASKSLCDYGLHMSITYWNEGIKKEIIKCIENEGITSFKVYMAYQDTIGVNDEDLISIMNFMSMYNVLVAIHCENGKIIASYHKKFLSEGKTKPIYHALSRPEETEIEAVKKVISFSKRTNCPIYIVHVSTGQSIKEIEKAQHQGYKIFAETCPHYLLLDEREYNKPDFNSAMYVMSPPLRSGPNKRELWKALKKGVIQCVSTDHCPFNLKWQKEFGINDFTKIPNGVGGVKERLALIYTYGVLKKRFSLNHFVNLTSTMPAKTFGLYPKKGTIEKNSDADVVLWDFGYKGKITKKSLLRNCETNIYEGFKIRANPHIVIVNGKIAFRDNKILIRPGSGNYLYRSKVKYSIPVHRSS